MALSNSPTDNWFKKPNEEPVDQLEKSIKECKDALVKNGYKENRKYFT